MTPVPLARFMSLDCGMDPASTPHGWRNLTEGVAAIVAAGLALSVIGGLTFGPGSFAMDGGFVLVIIGGTLGINAMLWRLMRGRIKALDDVYEEGARAGYARGYRDGRREGRPVVVPIRCPHCGEELGRKTG